MTMCMACGTHTCSSGCDEYCLCDQLRERSEADLLDAILDTKPDVVIDDLAEDLKYLFLDEQEQPHATLTQCTTSSGD